MRMKTKHSKYKNTGLIFEFLVRQITADVLDHKNKSSSMKLLKKSFNENTELGKELSLYNALMKEKFQSDKKSLTDKEVDKVMDKIIKISMSSDGIKIEGL